MTLNEVCEFIVDCPHTTAPDEGTGYPLIRTPNVGKGRLILEGVHRVSEEVYRERIQRGVPQEDDLILAREAPAGNVAIIKSGQKVCLGQRTVLLRPNNKIVFPDYLVYYLLAPAQQYQLLGSANGATVAHVNIPVIRNMPVEIPSLQTQKTVAKILSSYDNLIENNQKQIKLLEEAAQRLYKEWFVDLRFPGHENTPIVDGVPDGWKRMHLENLIAFEIGGGWGEEYPIQQSENGAYVIRGTDLLGLTHGNVTSIPFRYHSNTNLESRILKDGDIVFEVSGGSRTEGVARTALITSQLLNTWEKAVMCASFCKLVRPVSKELSSYLFYHFQYLRESGQTEEYDKRSASSIVNYRWKDFLSHEIILKPRDAVLQQYNNLAEDYYKQIITKSVQIETAKMTRDRLLPKLMSGEIEV